MKQSFITSDIDIYMKWSFAPLYSINGMVIIAIDQLRDEIIGYANEEYEHYRFIYITKEAIYKKLYHKIYRDYHREYSAKDLGYSLMVLLCILLLFVTIPSISIIILNVFYFIMNIFKLTMTVIGSFKQDRYKEKDVASVDFPLYTILIPIKNEKLLTINSLMKALSQLDYPKDKLDIKLVVESGDAALVANRGLRYDIIVVPYSLPQTKAKACNYALNFAKGKYITIYDADDRPHPLQLKVVLSEFQNDRTLVCVQAALNYYNYRYSYLTKCFALEYSNLFDFVLHGLEWCDFPILLGGTSNHFYIDTLRSLGGWDSYNVTEDADLGLRLKRCNYKVKVIRGYDTLEEAPIKVVSWVKQRARWIKGFIITYIVHMKSPIKLISDIGMGSFVIIQLLMVLPVIIYLFSPLLLVALFLSHQSVIYMFMLVNFILYFAINLLTSFLSLRYRDWSSSLILPALLMPIYNVLHSVASYRALWQLFSAPYKWDKTEHNQEK